ncbi:unnamed protein product [Brassica oleracea]
MTVDCRSVKHQPNPLGGLPTTTPHQNCRASRPFVLAGFRTLRERVAIVWMSAPVPVTIHDQKSMPWKPR